MTVARERERVDWFPNIASDAVGVMSRSEDSPRSLHT